ncbi:hypothetical protein P9112_012261 [Eukaryota sp. TZLM1-RC]
MDAHYDELFKHHNADNTFTGKRMRKPVPRKAVDSSSAAALRMIWKFRRGEDAPGSLASLRPHSDAFKFMHPVSSFARYCSAGVMLRYVHTCTNKERVPIYSVTYTPDARRIFTGTYQGEITLWNGVQFNFETILTAHSAVIHTLTWSKDGVFLISGDGRGEIRYWLSNMNNLKKLQPHSETIRDISVSHNNTKLITASTDKTMKVVDFSTTNVELVLEGHNADVHSAQWHNRFSLILSSSKDGTVRLWDPRSGNGDLFTSSQHRNVVNGAKWNPHNELSFASIGADGLAFSYDIRQLRTTKMTFRKLKKEFSSLQFHPIIPNYFVTGGSDGTLMHWDLTRSEPLHVIEKAHDNVIRSMAFHPMGNVLVTGANDHHTKIWAHNLPEHLLPKDQESSM